MNLPPPLIDVLSFFFFFLLYLPLSSVISKTILSLCVLKWDDFNIIVLILAILLIIYRRRRLSIIAKNDSLCLTSEIYVNKDKAWSLLSFYFLGRLNRFLCLGLSLRFTSLIWPYNLQAIILFDFFLYFLFIVRFILFSHLFYYQTSKRVYHLFRKLTAFKFG